MVNKSKKSAEKSKVKYIIAIVILIALIGCFLMGIGGAFGNTSEYTITFNTNGGSTIEKLYVKENQTIEKPQDPTREGYIFLGWYYNNELYDFNTPVTNNMELVARWQGDGKVSGVNLNKTALELTVGESTTLVATVTPADATNKNVTWKSSNTSIVSVDANGKVKALKAGTATITVTTKDGNYSATATITVIEKVTVKATGVVLNKTTVSLEEGKSITLVATVKPTDATNKNVTWKSSNTSVASVDSKGKVKALKAGTATITVTTKDGNYSATATITVVEKPASYTVTFKPIVQDVTNAVMQYSMTVTKNSASYSNYQFVIYNNKKISKNNYLAKEQYNKSITTAMIKLSDGTEVTAKVVYK